jgi:hypothetical protein
MKIIAALSWYDEQPDHLANLITSLHQADIHHLVAVDGAYSLYPNGTAASNSDQHEAIHDTAQTLGLDCTIHTPAQPWAGNEIHKRTLLFALAHTQAQPYTDWLLVIDGDDTITDPGDHRTILEHTNLQVATVRHTQDNAATTDERRLLRAHPAGIRVERAHHIYINGDGDQLWGHPGQQVQAEQTSMTIRHNPKARTPQRLAARAGYYEARLQTNAEQTNW